MYNILFKQTGRRIMAFLCTLALVITALGSNFTNVFAASASVDIDGFQISAAVEGFRTIYSVTDPSNEISSVGLVYGLKSKTAEQDMVVGSANPLVYSYEATSAGKLPLAYSGDTSYTMTMKFIKKAEFYNSEIIVRAYAKLNNGNYIYSDSVTFTVYNLAKSLYTRKQMSNKSGHEYVYNNILKVVNPNEEEVDYDWSDEIVDPTEFSSESQTQPSTTQKQDDGYVTAQPDWNELPYWSVYFAPDWGNEPQGAYKDGGSYNDFTLRIDKESHAEWGIQMKTQSIPVTAGNTYRATVKATSTKASDGTIKFKDDVTGVTNTYDVTEGDNTFTVEFVANDTARIFFDLGMLVEGTVFKITSFSLEDLGNTQPTEEESSAVIGDIDWNGIEYLADGVGGYANTFKAYSASDKVGFVNVQQPGFVEKPGIYATFPSGVSSVSLPEGSYHIEGASIIIYADSIPEGVTTFTVTDAQGTYTCAINRTTGGSTQPTQPSHEQSSSQTGGIAAPVGLVVTPNEQQRIYTIAFANVENADSYNLYVNGVKYGPITNGGTISMDASVFTAGQRYTITVTAVNAQGESAQSSGVDVVVPASGSGNVTQPATQQGGVESPTIVAGSYPTDPSLPKPFGVVVSSPDDNEIGVAWGAGTPNCYNVYIDNVLTWTGVAASYKSAYGYVQGVHTVSIATFQNNMESELVTYSIQVNGLTSGIEPTTPRTYNNSNKYFEDPIPQLPANVDTAGKNMYVKINNRTNGKYSDAQCYWLLIGNNENGVKCYVNSQGQAIPMSAADNTVNVNGQMVANYAHSLAECSFFYAPTTLISGRLYLSYEKPIYLPVHGDGACAEPSVENPSDPNAGTLFEFAEFTLERGKDMFTNTTRVDFFCFPVATRLIGEGGFVNGQGDAPTYDLTVGDMGTRDQIISKFLSGAPEEFKGCFDGTRIMAPCKKDFNEGKKYGNYYDQYINEFWTKYTNETLVFKSDLGKMYGRVQGDRMVFTKEGSSKEYYVYKPTTQDILEGRGNFNRSDVSAQEDLDRHQTELAIEAQMCAAFVRGVATQPEHWSHELYYYKTGKTCNYYAGFFHETSYDGFAYGFCYDDVFDHSTLLHYTNATGLIVDMKW